MSSPATRLAELLQSADASERLQASMAAGTHPEDSYLEPLIERCAVELDFSVREMLTWALTRLSHEHVFVRVVQELDSPLDQARSQALHTLSKLRDGRAATEITREHLHDSNDEIARTAWRAAAELTPFAGHPALAEELKQEFGRGELDVQRSLSRAFVKLGDAGLPAAQAALVSGDPVVRVHAAATLRLFDDPEGTFYLDPGDA